MSVLFGLTASHFWTDKYLTQEKCACVSVYFVLIVGNIQHISRRRICHWETEDVSRLVNATMVTIEFPNLAIWQEV